MFLTKTVYQNFEVYALTFYNFVRIKISIKTSFKILIQMLIVL